MIDLAFKAKDLMSSPVRTITPETTIEQALKILLRYGHSGLCVVDEAGQLRGIVSRRDLDLASHHGFSHALVRSYMTKNLKTITPETGLAEIESLMITYDLGRLPVLQSGNLIGILTRTDVLRQLYKERYLGQLTPQQSNTLTSSILPALKNRLDPRLWKILEQASIASKERGWHLYLVGGGVRDLLLAEDQQPLLLQDLDLVVDGFDNSADTGAGVAIASCLQKLYPTARLSVHGEFQTAALLWHKDPDLGSLWVDIATARTEFYPYPAANPQVEASSIRQDLYRRDFTINALAVRLTEPREGELLDFFGGLLDLNLREIRVLHPNSFIEDPTRIYRGVRFATKLRFKLESQTLEYINYALNSGIRDRLIQENKPAPAFTTRLKAELKYILQSPYWQQALKLLNDLKALSCVHPDLALSEQLWWQMRYLDRLIKYLDSANTLEMWLVRLEMLIASLPSVEATQVANNLELPKDSVTRLTELAAVEHNLKETLPNYQLPSEISNALRPYKVTTILLLIPRSPKKMRRQLWQYLTIWSKVQPLLNGDDLKALGYKPGPEFKQILQVLLTATLDGTITNRDQGEKLVEEIATKISI